MSDDMRTIQLYNEDEQELVYFFEYRRLLVYGRQYALLQPEDDPNQLITFRLEFPSEALSAEEEAVYIYVTDEDELKAVEGAWNKLHS